MTKERTQNLILITGAVILFLSAWFKEGYYHADEHHQILEWAKAFLEGKGHEFLTWEYSAQIRPNFQTLLAAGVMRSARAIGFDNPHHIALILRLGMAVLSFFTLKKFSQIVSLRLPSLNRNLVLASFFFLWFIPTLSIRFSSEMLSGLTFILGLCSLLDKKNKNYYMAGLFFGLSFITRFQIGFCILGVLIWQLWVRKEGVSSLFKMIPGLVLCLGLLMVSDFLIYQEFVFTPWKYFEINLVEDVSSKFGTHPFYHYFHHIILKSNLWIGVLVLLSLFYLIVRDSKHILNFIIWPFFIVHMIIPHKEIRFLFPLVFFLPWLMLEVCNVLSNVKLKKAILISLAAINLLYLIPAIFSPAGKGEVRVMRLISEEATQSTIVYLTKETGLNLFGGFNNQFYRNKDLEYKYLTLVEIDETFLRTNNYVVILSPEEAMSCKITSASFLSMNYPDWIRPFKKFYRGRRYQEYLVLGPDKRLIK